MTKLKWRRFWILAALVLLVITMWIVVMILSSILYGSTQLQISSGHPPVASRPVKIDVYYETLCPDSIAFILNQLWPTYQIVSPIMDVNMIPFGKGRVSHLPNGSWAFRCQHGEPECYGNLVQTCALTKYDVSNALPMIVCMERASQPEVSGPDCATKVGLDFDPVKKCTLSSEGNAEQYKFANKTLALKLRFVPWIAINDNASSSIQSECLSNLLRVVCNAYKGKKPSDCPVRQH